MKNSLTIQEPRSSASEGLRVGEDDRIESSNALILAPLGVVVPSFLSSFFQEMCPLGGNTAESGIATAKANGMPDLASGITIFWFVMGGGCVTNLHLHI